MWNCGDAYKTSINLKNYDYEKIGILPGLFVHNASCNGR